MPSKIKQLRDLSVHYKLCVIQCPGVSSQTQTQWPGSFVFNCLTKFKLKTHPYSDRCSCSPASALQHSHYSLSQVSYHLVVLSIYPPLDSFLNTRSFSFLTSQRRQNNLPIRLAYCREISHASTQTRSGTSVRAVLCQNCGACHCRSVHAWIRDFGTCCVHGFVH